MFLRTEESNRQKAGQSLLNTATGPSLLLTALIYPNLKEKAKDFLTNDATNKGA